MRDRRKTLLTVSGVAIVALGVGVLAGRFVTSPADAAADAKPPPAGAITAPVEFRALEATVVTRGDAKFAGAVSVTPQVAGLMVPPIVTGQVPKVGDKITETAPVLEIAGRPVLALKGELPMYRTLSPGTAGPDVEQLEKTLDRLGYDPGTVDEEYMSSTGAAVAELYEDAGYEAPPADMEAEAEVDAATDNVDVAQAELDMAEQTLADASRGPSAIEKKQAEQEVDAAKRTLDAAKADGDKNMIADAEDQLELAELRLKQLLDGPSTSAEQDAVDTAKNRLSEANTALADAQEAASTPLPASEVTYLATLPRRVDSVEIKRGDELSGAAMSVSGADIVIVANVSDTDREQLSADMSAVLDLPTGDQVEGVISDIAAAKGDGASGFDVTIEPNKLSKGQVTALRDASIRVTIPITSTGGKVLAVPVAALTAGPGGESRVELWHSDDDTELVEVEVGLTAEGFAEISPADGELAEEDLVVVGR